MDRQGKQNFAELLEAFIDGELDASGRQTLLAMAAEDRQHGAELAAALEMQQALAALPQQRAPASLSRALRRIPQKHGGMRQRPGWLVPSRWAIATVLAVALLGGHSLYQHQQHLQQETELAQAKKELALVLAYLEKVNRNTNHQIQHTVNEVTAKPVARITTRTLQEQLRPKQETEL